MTYQNDAPQGGGSQGYSGGFRGGYQNRPPRQMVDVTAMNIKCADCGAAITELPFQPDPNRLTTLRCRDCLRKSRPPRY